MLVLYFCLAAPALGCQEVRMAEASIQACMIDGETQAAKWIADHPGYELDRWRCASGERI
jgi:hypothetical protein